MTPELFERTLLTMGEVIDLLGPRSRWLADSRGRSLKATWHAEAEMVVLSLWESDRCVGTFQLSAADHSS